MILEHNLLVLNRDLLLLNLTFWSPISTFGTQSSDWLCRVCLRSACHMLASLPIFTAPCPCLRLLPFCLPVLRQQGSSTHSLERNKRLLHGLQKHQLLLLADFGADLDLLILLDNLLVCSQLEVPLLDLRVRVALDRDVRHVCRLLLFEVVRRDVRCEAVYRKSRGCYDRCERL